MTDPLHETGRISITAGMARAMSIHGAARMCPHCKLGIPKYVGRYPSKCPRCKGSMKLDEAGRALTAIKKVFTTDIPGTRAATSAIGTGARKAAGAAFNKFAGRDSRGNPKPSKPAAPPRDKAQAAPKPPSVRPPVPKTPKPTKPAFVKPKPTHKPTAPTATRPAPKPSVPSFGKRRESVLCEPRTNRLQKILAEGGVSHSRDAYHGDPACSKAMTIPYGLIEGYGGIEGFKVWLEGPTNDGTYYRIESIDGPVMCFNFLDEAERCRLFATENPTRYLGFDPREEMIQEDHESTFLDEPMSEGWDDRQLRVMAKVLARSSSDDPLWDEVIRDHMRRTNINYGKASSEVEAAVRKVQGRESVNEDQTLRSLTYGPEMAAQRNRMIDKTHDRVSGAFIEDMRASMKRRRKPGEGPTQVRGPFRIHVGANKTRKPRKDVAMSLQNKMNAKRGLRGRIQGAKKWHQGRKGQELHQALAHYNRGRSKADEHDAALRGKLVDTLDRIKRYNSGQQRQIGTPIVEVTETPSGGGAGNPSQIQQPTTEDHLEGILRKLIVSNDMDVLQDVHFDERDGAMYLFFDPILMHDEIQEILMAVRRERGDIDLIASPDGSLPEEAVESLWWVLYAPGPMGGGPSPDIYAADADQHYTKAQMVINTPPSPPEALAQGVDVSKLIKAAGEKR